MRTFRDTTTSNRAAGAGGPAGTPGKQTLVEAELGGGEVIITASSLRVRSSPDTSSKANVIGKLHEGDRVTTVGQDGSWLITPFAGTDGYISGKYTKPASIVDDITDWFKSWIGGGGHDHEDDGPTGPTPTPKVDPGEPPAPEGPDTPTPVTPTPETPSGPATLSDTVFAGYLAGLANPTVDAAAHAVASCEQQSATLAKKLDLHEEKGAGRDELVAAIGQARVAIAALDGAGLAADTLAYVKSTLNHLLLRTAPYYAQGRNINILEDEGQFRTCNLTVLAMVLEGLGKSANDYAGPRDKLIAVARYTPYAALVDGARAQVGGGTGDFGKLAGLRLPDFLELAAVAHCANGTTDEDIVAAEKDARRRIVKEFAIHRKLAERFGVASEYKEIGGDLLGPLNGISKGARKKMMKVVDARNKAERTGEDKDEAKYEKLRDASATALEGDKIESKVPIDDYREIVIASVGPELASGAGVFMLMAGHYARVEMVTEDHVVVDDPGQDHRSNQKVLWEEARAMGYFKKRLVFR